MEHLESSIQFYDLIQMFNAAVHLIETKRDYLDSINVFPVPDSDTGLNLLLSLRSISIELENKKPQDLISVKSAIKKGAFSGAKGNSGVILSQFIIGFVDHLVEPMTTESFRSSLINGFEKAEKSILNPVEGTMVTVMRKCRDLVQESKEETIPDLVEAVFTNSQKYTLETMDELDLLKKAKVVDSGSLGLVYVFQSWLNTLNGYKHRSLSFNLEEFHNEIDEKSINELSKQRFCLEVTVSSTGFNEELSSRISKLGDSYLEIKDNGFTKFHIHTNQVERIYTIFSGSILKMKVDDMLTQSQFSHN